MPLIDFRFDVCVYTSATFLGQKSSQERCCGMILTRKCVTGATSQSSFQREEGNYRSLVTDGRLVIPLTLRALACSEQRLWPRQLKIPSKQRWHSM